MIIFYGIASKESIQFIYNKLKRIWIFSGLVVLLLIGGPIILMAKDNPIVYLYTLIPICQFILFCFIPKMMIKMYNCNRIEISEDYLSSGVGRKYQLRDLADVKTVNDWGEWYEVIFYFPHKSVGFICQKDLLVEGTIEEFEKLFEDKIVRKYKTKD